MKKILSFLTLFTMLIVGTIPMIYAEEKTACLDDAVKVLQTEQGLKINVLTTEEYNILPGDRISVIMLKTGSEFETAREKYIIYGDFCTVDEKTKTRSFVHILNESNEEGNYPAKITWSRGSLKAEKVLNVRKIAEENLSLMYDAFKSATEGTFADVYEEYVNEKQYVYSSKISGIDKVSEQFASSFVYARKLMAEGGKITESSVEIDSVDNLYHVFEVAVIIDTLKYKSEEEIIKCIEEKAQYAPKLFGSNPNTEKFISVYEASATDDIYAFIDNIRLASALAKIKNGNLEDITKALTEFADILKVDLEKIEENGFSVGEIASKLSNSVPQSYYDGLEDEINEIINAAKETTSKNNSSSSSGSSGGGGGGGSISVSPSMIVKPSEIIPGKEPEPDKKVFDDIDCVSWAKDAIEELYKKNILNGDGNGKFNPERPVTREEFVKMYVVAFSVAAGNKELPSFIDCMKDDWYYTYVTNAYTSGLVNGLSAELFGAGTQITRQDVSVMLLRLLLDREIKLDSEEKTFNDSKEIAEYARQAVGILAGMNIVNGYEDGSFAPNAPLTRAESASLIYRMLSIIN